MNKHILTGVLIVFFVGIYIMKENSKPRGIRNNNPLNIRESLLRDDDWVGEHELDIDKSFEEFSSPEYGIRAATKILKTYREKYNLLTIEQIINRWAPEIENDTNSYVLSVSSKVGIEPNDVLLVADYPKLIAAMIYHENGVQPYSDEVINTGFEMGYYS